MPRDIRFSFSQKNPFSSICESWLIVQRSKKQKFPLVVGVKQETTQKPSAGGGREFPVSQDGADIFTGSPSELGLPLAPLPGWNGNLGSSRALSGCVGSRIPGTCAQRGPGPRTHLWSAGEQIKPHPSTAAGGQPMTQPVCLTFVSPDHMAALHARGLRMTSTETPAGTAPHHRAGGAPNTWTAQVQSVAALFWDCRVLSRDPFPRGTVPTGRMRSRVSAGSGLGASPPGACTLDFVVREEGCLSAGPDLGLSLSVSTPSRLPLVMLGADFEASNSTVEAVALNG